MDVTAALPITDADKEQLTQILKCEANSLEAELKEVASAAITEYVEMFVGRKVFTRGSDMREYRLFCLIKFRYKNRLPTEDEVSALFQSTTSQSRTLLRAVVSKYQYELSAVIQDALKEAVANLTQDEEAGEGSDWYLDALSEYVVERLNHRIASIGPSLGRLTREQGTASRYIVKPATRDALRNAYGLE